MDGLALAKDSGRYKTKKHIVKKKTSLVTANLLYYELQCLVLNDVDLCGPKTTAF